MHKKIQMMFLGINDEFFVRVARSLRERDVDLKVLVGGKVPSEEFPGSVILNDAELLSPEFYERMSADSSEALSAELINGLKDCQDIFLSNSDRFAYYPLSINERKTIYYNIVRYWHNFLKKHPVDIIFFENVPHMNWDNVLYGVAQKMGIKVVCVERTGIDDAVMLVDDYKSRMKVPADFCAGYDKEALIGSLGKEFYDTVFKEACWIEYNARLVEKGSAIRSSAGRQMKSHLGFARHLIRALRDPAAAVSSAFAFNPSVNRIAAIFLEYKEIWRQRGLEKFYRTLTEPVNCDEKFVYFSLHFQPERTSIPLAGVFENQALALEILSKAIPEDWKIYVKEHPRQLMAPKCNARHYRSRKFYERIKSIPKVVLLNIEEENQELIRRAAVVATLTGSPGWEALLSGKPALIFGYPWYMECASCFKVDSVESCQRAIPAIQNKSREAVESDVLKFLNFYKPQFINSTVHYIFIEQSKGDIDRYARNLSDAIFAYVHSKMSFLDNKILCGNESAL